MIVGNDATMAAVAEARAHRTRVLLHLVVEVGIGGALVIDGRPAPSAHSLHGEFGHLPFGDPREHCHCGASGCWEIPFDARHAAARLGEDPPPDPRAWLAAALARPAPPKAVRELREALGASLGRGCAGLVNALDPDAVTLGGLAGAVREAAPVTFDQCFAAGLMTVHRETPPAVVTALAGENAALIGAGLAAFDHVLDAARLAHWAGGGDGR
jgi:predicted NBD/HSP70 family sugar kinase